MKEMPSNQTSRTAVCQAGATLELGDSEGGEAESALVEPMMMAALLFLLYRKRQGAYDWKMKKLGKGVVVRALSEDITVFVY